MSVTGAPAELMQRGTPCRIDTRHQKNGRGSEDGTSDCLGSSRRGAVHCDLGCVFKLFSSTQLNFLPQISVFPSFYIIFSFFIFSVSPSLPIHFASYPFITLFFRSPCDQTRPLRGIITRLRGIGNRASQFPGLRTGHHPSSFVRFQPILLVGLCHGTRPRVSNKGIPADVCPVTI